MAGSEQMRAAAVSNSANTHEHSAALAASSELPRGHAESDEPPSSASPALPEWVDIAAQAQLWTVAVRADQNYGSGIFVDARGFILTNLHVIEGARSITAARFGAEPEPVELIESDPVLDLALLRATGATLIRAGVPSAALVKGKLAGGKLSPGQAGDAAGSDRAGADAAEFGQTSALRVGDEVLAVGSPRKMHFSVSRGMISFPNRVLDGVEYIQTDLPINVGNSGGPLVDRQGRIVGVVSFILRDSQGISFALPIDRALERFASQLSLAGATREGSSAKLP